jgi:hypothetical protein
MQNFGHKHQGDLVIDGKVILKMGLTEIGYKGVKWIQMALNKIQCQAFMSIPIS